MDYGQVHAVVCAYPALGHIYPMVHLSTLLATRGIRVTFVCTQYFCDRLRRRANVKGQVVEESGEMGKGKGQEEEEEEEEEEDRIEQGRGLEQLGVKQQWSRLEEKNEGEGGQEHVQQDYEQEGCIRFEALCDGLPPNFDRRFPSTELSRAVDQLHSAFEELMRRLLQSSLTAPSLLISDAFLPWTHDIAVALHIPSALFWPQSMAVFTIFAHTELLLTKGVNPFQEDLATTTSRVIDFIPGIPALPTSHLPYRVKPVGGQDRRFLLYENLVKQSKQCKEVRWILANSFNYLEGPLPKLPQNNLGVSMRLVGPLFPLPYKEELWVQTRRLEDILQWLNTKSVSSVLYISLGSVVAWTEKQVEEVGLGLMAKKQAFLWVMRPWEMRLAVPKGLLKLGRIVKFAPQLQILGHPAIGGFMSHCGWNSTLESLSMGVPMLVWPHFLDQFTNCWYVVHVWKVGVELLVMRRGDFEEAIVDRSEFEMAVTLLMQAEDGQLMRLRASKFRDLARHSVLLGSSCRNLEVFLSELVPERIAT